MKRITHSIVWLTVLLAPVLVHADTESASDSIALAKQYYSFGMQHKNAGNNEEARRQLEQSIAAYDSLHQVYYVYGEVLMSMNDKKGAAEAYEKVLALNPDYYNAAARLTTLYYDRGDYEAALDMYRLMHELKPDNPRVVASIANIEEFLGDTEAAYANLVQLVDMGEDSYENLMRIATLAVKRGDYESAHMYAVLALNKKSGDKTALELAGRTALQEGDRGKAVGFYRELAEKDSPKLETIKTLEDIYRAMSDRQNLIWALKRHHKHEPENVEVLGELCENFYPDGLSEEGIAYVKKGIELAPDDGRFRILMGENYLKLGQTELALEEFRRAMNDERWKSNAQRLIWQIEPPESDDEKAERDFFNRGE